jgi:cytochrome c biogenesis protein CcmG/thiol:disulfide interchange protein DsbE
MALSVRGIGFIEPRSNMMKSRVLLWGLTGLAVALTFWSLGQGASEGIKIGTRVPVFALKTMAGERVTDQSLEGQIVIMNFWSTSCSSCVKELPELQKVAESSQATVIGVALDEEGWRTIRPYLDHHQVTFRVVLGDEALFERFNGDVIPYTLLLDRSLRVVKIYRGPVKKETLEREIRSLTEKG